MEVARVDMKEQTQLTAIILSFLKEIVLFKERRKEREHGLLQRKEGKEYKFQVEEYKLQEVMVMIDNIDSLVS